MSGVNATELKIIEWLKMEWGRNSKVWPFLRDVAEGNEFQYGDGQLSVLLSDLFDGSRGMHAEILLAELGADLPVARELRRELAEGRDDPMGWVEEMTPSTIRAVLLGEGQ